LYSLKLVTHFGVINNLFNYKNLF